MHFYVDESGHTGQNLFDLAQPMLFYGVLSSRLNVDVIAAQRLAQLRRSLSVPRLHAAELGNGRLVSIAPELVAIQRNLGLRFDLYRVAKADHAVISFFDQVFDQGMNPAVPWHCYWTPMRYPLLLKLAHLFDENLAKQAWSARLSRDDQSSNLELVAICDELLARLNKIPDARSRTILGDALTWARNHPNEIRYNAKTAQEAIVVAPNSVGFQQVILGITARVAKIRPHSVQITVDRQTQFNKAQRTVTEWYQKAKGSTISIGPGMPQMDLRRIPDAPLRFASSFESPGLELVDIYLWTFKRFMENREIAPELYSLVHGQVNRGRTDEISLRGIEHRWGKWFAGLPDLTPDDLIKGRALLQSIETNRQAAITSADGASGT